MNTNEIDRIFGEQLRGLGIEDFEKRTFKLRRFIENGVH